MGDLNVAGGGTISGAAEGAAAGWAVGGPWGAVIGGVVGAAAGLFGDKSSHFMRKAAKDREEIALIQNFLERRATIQQYQLARSSVIAGGLASGAGAESSAILGGVEALGTSVRSNLYRNAQQVALGRRAAKYTRSAGKAQEMSGAIGGVLNAGLNVASMFDFGNNTYSASAQRAGTGTYTSMGSTPLSAGAIPMPTTINTSPFIRG